MAAHISEVQDDIDEWMGSLQQVMSTIDVGRGRRIVVEEIPEFRRSGHLGLARTLPADLPYARFRLEYDEEDNEDPSLGVQLQQTRWWYIEPNMNTDAIIKAVWLATTVSDEHQRREWFRVRGELLFSPHRGLWRQK